jgi:glycerol 2-dehydrogenase (NADP+)
MSTSTFITLSNGVKMPIFGLGTWQSSPGEVEKAVHIALDEGYRLIDTAAVYQNEAEIGKALTEYLAKGKLTRKDVFLTTKLWCTHLRKADTESQLREQLKKLQKSYVDLYLAHVPGAYNVRFFCPYVDIFLTLARHVRPGSFGKGGRNMAGIGRRLQQRTSEGHRRLQF